LAQDSSTRIGLVVFAGFAQVAVPPTTERAELIDAVDSLTTGRGTMIGAAILKAVDAIAQINPDVEPVGAAVPGASGGLDGLGDSGAPGAQTPDSSSGSGGAAPQGEKKFAPEIVVLLTDGANTGGVSPAQAAQLAAERGVRIYPIGFGTTNPTTLVCTAEQLGGTRFDTFRPGGGGGPNRRSFLVADESTLREVAQTTGGTYFAASGANQLQEVLKDLPRQVEVQQKNVELSAGFAALAAVLVLASVAAAVRWSAFPS
jgi:Ca-activated chloride channel family protein